MEHCTRIPAELSGHLSHEQTSKLPQLKRLSPKQRPPSGSLFISPRSVMRGEDLPVVKNHSAPWDTSFQGLSGVNDVSTASPRAKIPYPLSGLWPPIASHCDGLPFEHDQNQEKGGASIPSELFNDILFHVGYDYETRTEATANVTPRTEWKDIAACSLVCRYWANRCRLFMFSDVTLYISSPAQAQTFVKYATRGCPTLIPVHTLIREIEVEQRYDASPSFCHRLHILKSRLGGQLAKLTLSGPVPEGFPSCKLDTPYWSQSHVIPTAPSLLPYSEILAHHIHLPSFDHVAKYIRHFEYPYKLSFDRFTWDDDGTAPYSFPRFQRRNSRKLEGQNESTYNVAGCTDNSRLCLHIAMTHRQSLLHMLDDNERHWVIILLQWLHGSFSYIKPNPAESCHWVNTLTETSADLAVTEAQISTMIRDVSRACIFSFALELGGSWSESRDLAAHNTHVVGLEAWLGWKSEDEEDFQVDIDQLMSYLWPFPMLRVIVLNFCSYRHLLGAMWRYRPVAFTTRPEIDDHRQYVFVFRRQEEDHKFLQIPESYKDWVGIDPITLSLTGQSWSNTDDIVRPLLANSR